MYYNESSPVHRGMRIHGRASFGAPEVDETKEQLMQGAKATGAAAITMFVLLGIGALGDFLSNRRK